MIHKTDKKNILMVHNYYQIPGGEDTVVANEKKMLEEHGHKVILYSRNNSELKQMTKWRKLTLPFLTVFNPRTYSDIKRLIRAEHIDIVHVHNTLNLISPSVYYAARAMRIPVVQTIHNFRLLCPSATFYRDGHICEDCVTKGLLCAVKYSCYRGSKMQTLACVISTKIHRMTGIYGKINYICLTEFNREKLLKLKQIEPERVFVKPNFVESDDGYVPKENRENQFVFAGRLDKLKGINVLFEAWKQMGETAPRLIVCGTGPMEKWCRDFLEENPTCNVEIKGFVPNKEVRKLVAKCRALILPTQWYEGFPMSIVEAFSVGTPVICSDLGNAGNLVRDSVTGCKFKENSVEGLVLAVKRCKGMCNKVFSEYQSKYTPSKNYEKLSYIYLHVIYLHGGKCVDRNSKQIV